MTGGRGRGGAGNAGDTSDAGTLQLDAGTSTGPTADASPDACGNVELPMTAKKTVVPGNVLVVFDRSLSMEQSFGSTSKYQAAGQALVDAVKPIESDLVVGALLFPSPTANSGSFGGGLCAPVDPITAASQIPFSPGAVFIQKWQSWLSTAKLLLGTPIDKAFQRASDALSPPPAQGATVVVLFTDGEPTCPQSPSADQIAASLLGQGIKTYVVGLPGAQGVTYLDKIAKAGGTNNYLLPTDATQLQQQLASIAKQTVTTALDNCTLTLNPPPADPTQVHLVVTLAQSGKTYQVPQGPGQWTLSKDGKTVTLTGATCDAAKAGDYSKIELLYGCVSAPPLPS